MTNQKKGKIDQRDIDYCKVVIQRDKLLEACNGLLSLLLDKYAFKMRDEKYLENQEEFGIAIAVLTRQFNSKEAKQAMKTIKDCQE